MMNIQKENIGEKKRLYVSSLNLSLIPDQSALRNWDEMEDQKLKLYSIHPSRTGLERYVLPWHHHRGDFELIPPTGLTIPDAAERYTEHKEKIERNNTMCDKSFEVANELADDGDLGIIVASTVKLSAYSYTQFAPEYEQDHLFHMDGLHRGIVGYLNENTHFELLVFAQSENDIHSVFT